MPKRKCGQVTEQDSESIRNPPPLRKSARLQALRDRQLQPEVKPQHLCQLPSLSLSRSPDQVLCRKRKEPDTRSLEEDSPPKRPRPSGNEPEAKPATDCNPIKEWIKTGYWPTNLAEEGFEMGDSTNPLNCANKRRRTSSYTQSVKDGEVPEAYTRAYEIWISTKGLDMDVLTGEQLASNGSKELCIGLRKITYKTIEPTLFPTGSIRNVINSCRYRNEAKVNRDVTTMIIPPIEALFFAGHNNLKHVVDEISTNWGDRCVLAGPRPRPDLAIGLLSSAFTEAEIDKLNIYNSVNNLTRFTELMYFPFLMCEVKCGREGLDMADRQNMHSCSVAVKAILRIEEEADKYRQEKGLAELNGQVLVFSLSQDQRDVRLYGHYAFIQNAKWLYYRYEIQNFHILSNKDDLLAVHNFVRNILDSYLPGHVRRLKEALAALPEPSMQSSSASTIALGEADSQQYSQDVPPQDAGFQVPGEPASVSKWKKLEQQWKEKLQQELERQREEAKQREDQLREESKQRHKELMDLLKEQKSS